MAYSLIASAIAGAGADHSTVTSAGIDTTGADLIVICAVHFGSGLSVSDSKGNTWTSLTSRTGTNTRLSSFYVASPSVGGSHTFTFSGTANLFPSLTVMAFSGAAASPFDRESGASGSGTSAQPGSVTPSENNCLVVGGIGVSGNRTFSVSGLTLQHQIGNDGNHQAMAAGYTIQTTASALNPTWTISASDNWASEVAVFKSAAGGGGATGQPTMRRWGGTPFVGGQGIGNKGSGRMWGRSREGMYVPRRFAA